MSTLPPPISDQPVLKLSNVESAYGPIKAIRGVSLQVRRGEIATVLGSNGAGKTACRHHSRRRHCHGVNFAPHRLSNRKRRQLAFAGFQQNFLRLPGRPSGQGGAGAICQSAGKHQGFGQQNRLQATGVLGAVSCVLPLLGRQCGELNIGIQ